MLWVYSGLNLVDAFKLAKKELPPDAIDLSKVESGNLATSVHDYCNHHVGGHIFLGFVDPVLMLHPTEETRLRRGFTQCTMSIVVSNPLLLPLSWKNGTSYLRVIEGANVESTSLIHNGSVAHVRDEAEHGRTPSQTPDKRDTPQSGKTRNPPKRRKQAGQNQAKES